MYSTDSITSTADCGSIHICGEDRNYMVTLGKKSTLLFDTLIQLFNGQLNRPYVIKSLLPQKPAFGIIRLNDSNFLNMKKSHRDFFTMLVDHYTGLQVIYEDDESKIDYPVHIYGHNAEHVWRIHCNDIVTEIYVDAKSIVDETFESFWFAYQRDE